MKKLTVSSEKDKYGIHLKAEPDNQTLGRRLKGAFKQVSQAIKGQLDKRVFIEVMRSGLLSSSLENCQRLSSVVEIIRFTRIF